MERIQAWTLQGHLSSKSVCQLLSDFKGWHDFQDLAQGTVEFFLEASNGRLQYNIVQEIVVEDG